ncbi:MAG TPA: hypothetical protein VG675_14725 [Bryobacteraceae bacterium]|nr:hypothetical protein [Bryobacteraceae bacterium]
MKRHGKPIFETWTNYLIYQDGGVFDSQPQNMPGTELETKQLNSLA